MQCPQIQKDMNGDGVQTISDLWSALGAAYHWPGDKIIELVAQAPKNAEFFEIGTQTCGGWVSIGLSTLAWFAILMAMGMVGVLMDRT